LENYVRWGNCKWN